MSRIRFTVTEDDVRLGRRGKATRCPVARALKRATGQRWYVDHEVAYVDQWDQPMMEPYRPSRRTARFIMAFDDRRNPRPFTGEILAAAGKMQEALG